MCLQPVTTLLSSDDHLQSNDGTMVPAPGASSSAPICSRAIDVWVH